MIHNETLLQKRDVKVASHLVQYAPVWLTNERILSSDEAVEFNIVFLHKDYGWVNRRYFYDGFNDVLYYRGQVALPEEQVLSLQQQTLPYIPAKVSNIRNSYGG